ncbi:hypothetical protein Anapl_10796 [Anas platyrhynchos]|uniref:Uncharacterized protein n=1 Tax=Anas platyrhynchos TaxID=8839 RepID=R0LTF8_ANAPL|nr:hypothetical protein Anapl_10796 [Anas platyrhynchos]
MTVITVHCVNISGKSISLQADTMDNYGSFKTGFGLATAFAAVYGGPAVRELSRRTGIQLTHQISTPNSSLGGLEKTPRYRGRQAVRGNPLEKQSTSLLSKKKPGCSKRRAGDLCRLCKDLGHLAPSTVSTLSVGKGV